MRELERNFSSNPPSCRPDAETLAVVGRGRLGTALTDALRDSGWRVTGPLGHGAVAEGFDAVLLCVPDAQIAAAAAVVAPGAMVGHCSGATGLGVLAPHEGFSLHPLMTIAAGTPTGGNPFAGAAAAVAGASPRALELATTLALSLRMRPVEVTDDDRAAYHAAASIASNFLITLEAAAERMAASAGVEREMLVPLVHATVENWARLGAREALTGPVARGDEATVRRQRDAVATRAADLLPLFDALVAATRALAAAGSAPTIPEVSLA